MISAFVFDTNALISAHILPDSVSRQAYDLADNKGILVFSHKTLREFADVFSRAKFDRYQSIEERLKMVSIVESRGQLIEITERVHICRDPTDDMFLELAVSAQALAIVTGDPDLLSLHPFRDIHVLSAADFLKLF